MLLGIITNAFEYIKNGLPHVTLGQVLALLAGLTVFSKWVESFLGKKFVGTWIFAGIKRVALTPSNILKSQENINNKLQTIENEVKYNGGKYLLRDAVAQLKVTCEDTAALVRDLSLNQRVAEEIDNMMLFRMDATGYLLSANRAYLDYFGFKETDVRGLNWENTIHRNYLQEVQVKWARAVQTHSEFLDTHIIKDGEGVGKRCTVRAIPITTNEKLHGFYGTVTPLDK